jgi:sugar phosphate isomerase/epimerase
MQRRHFLQFASSAAVASIARPLWAHQISHRYVDQIGLQLWTVRNQIAADLNGTIKAVADAGYWQVELGDVMKADDIVKAAADNGLKVTSSFLDWNIIGNPEAKDVASVDQVVEKASALKLKHLVFGYIGKGHRESSDHYRRHAERANVAGEKCAKAGIQLNYHNHSFEFGKLPDGTTGFDVLKVEFDPKLVKFELDVFWAQIGGLDALAAIDQLGGRIAQLHLKDLKKGTPVIHDERTVPADAFRELGNGVISMAEVIKAGEACGVEQCHVEQDQSPDPIVSIRQSCRHLKTL